MGSNLEQLIADTKSICYQVEALLSKAHHHTRSKKLKEAVHRLSGDVEALMSVWNGRYSMMEEGVDYKRCASCYAIGSPEALTECSICDSSFCYDCSNPPIEVGSDVCSYCYEGGDT